MIFGFSTLGYTPGEPHQNSPSFYSRTISIGYTLKARWLGDLFNRVPKARGE